MRGCCPLCGHSGVLQEAGAAWVDSSCARCGLLLARVPLGALVGVRA